MSAQDEVFEKWWAVESASRYLPSRLDAQKGWNERGEHDAAELARKDALLAAYREFTEATDAIRRRRGAHETLREQFAARHRIEELGGAKIAELEADDGKA